MSANAPPDRGNRVRTRSRGQVHTLEAFTAALLVVSGVLFALQATAVTPLTASTSNQHIENQHRTAAADVLSAGAENGTLRPAVTFWDPDDSAFVAAGSRGFYTNGGPPNAFGAALNDTFGGLSTAGRRIAYNVEVRYRTPDGDTRKQTMVYMGSPSDNAAAATRTVVLADDTPLSGASGNVSSANFYAPDAAPNASFYNVMEVRIVVWQM
ncbi:hypothetical protein M0R88_14095 [Halorussus gelatinilyticus]|uniref:Uncharacterized protein n=1 Tax=Halorussus gelatinilyticus TaxID=2937524 RepID=A0A8U0IG15_9EURY|nr:hypothetical protein [Halorussus gelatinilyticus]UPV99640.1 hypothetical protein M0R88_14095 [Halorussus gelatinilyticus]